MLSRMMALWLALGWPLFAQAQEQGRAARYYDMHIDLPEIGLVVAVPYGQDWNFIQLERRGPDALVLNSPPYYYPTTSMQIQLHATRPLTPDALPAAAFSYANQVRRQLSLPELVSRSSLEPVRYGDIDGYADVFEQEMRGEPYTVRSVFATMPGGEPLTLMVATPKGQLAHIDETAAEMWSMLRLHASPERESSRTVTQTKDPQ